MSVPSPEISIRGVPVSLGIEIGSAYILQEQGIHFPSHSISSSDVDSQLARLERAWEVTVQQIEEMRAAQQSGERHLLDDIIDIHLMLANDMPLYIGGRVEELIRKNLFHAETAFHQALQELLDKLSKSPLQRSEDVADIGQQVLRNLVGLDVAQFDDIVTPVVVVAEDLSPSLTVRLPKDKVLAFATARGSRTSHTAIMARALGIPAVVGVSDLLELVADGEEVIIDGDRGQVVIRPEPLTLTRFHKLREEALNRFATQSYYRELAPETRDGFLVDLCANIELPEEVESVIEHGGHGIGLYRTEFLFLNRIDLPTEDEQFLAYKAVAEAMAPAPVTIRTLDIGGDKFLSSVRTPQEMNPFMGWRAIRFCLVERDIFHTQLRAILRASAFGNISIMFPMISEVRELRLARAALLDAENELREEGVEIAEKVEVGAMIEVPSAALVMEGLTPMAEFFSIGTNDLIQYTVAADRGNEKTAYLYDPLHPGVLRLIKGVVDCAHAAGRRVCVCGEMAAGIEFTLVLAGLMVDQLSMSPIAIPEVKRLIRSINFEDAVLAAHQVLAMTEPEKIRETILRRTVELAPWTADFLSVGIVSSN